jgi:hypothetical protein
MTKLKDQIYSPVNLLKFATQAAFPRAVTVGDPDNANLRDKRRYTEKPGEGFRMADSKVPWQQPRTNQYASDHTTTTYPSVGGNLQDDFIGKASRSGQFSNNTRIGKTFLP